MKSTLDAPQAAPIQFLEPAKPVDLEQQKRDSAANTSFILGFVAILAWLLPIAGYPVTIIGLVKGIQGIKSSRSNRAVTGIVMNSVFLALTMFNSILGALIMMG